MKKIFLPYGLSCLEAGSDVVVSGDDYYHIAHSLRSVVGDEFVIGDDDGVEYSCRISAVTKSTVTLSVVEPFVRKNGAKPQLILAFSLLKGDKNEEIIKRCTEIGVDRFVPVVTGNSIPRIDDKSITKKISRWQTIAREASMQSGRQKIPRIDDIVDFKRFLNVPLCQNKIFGRILSDTDAKDVLPKCVGQDIAVFVGPEGDFTCGEEDELLAKGWNGVSFDTNVLRSETAAIYIASILNFLQ